MSAPSIPVDLRNPGQVFACLGFLEAADVLLGDAEGGFDWSDEGNVSFALRARGERNPFEVVLEFLAEAEPKRWGPKGYADPPPKKGKGGRVEVWRGGVRPSMSVPAPFVWRCLSGSAVAPFPHPAHRTGRADFPHPALGQDLTPSFACNALGSF